MANEELKIYSLSSVATGIQNALRDATSKTIWVRAEIATGNTRGGSYYCDLVETDQAGTITTKIRAACWSRSLQSIRAKFKGHGVDFPPPNGTAAVLLCRLTFHQIYGLSLTIVDADPNFLLGDIERRRRETLEALQREGLFEINRMLPVPTLPLKVGLITSDGSAAYNDFVQTLRGSGYAFQIYVADAIVQGDKTEASVIAAMSRISQLNCDLLCIIRGGGSKTDLAGFDNERISREIASYSKPVWVGLGHEIDDPVANYVSGRAFVTPTAVAEELVECCAQVERFLDEAIERFRSVCETRINSDQVIIERAAERLQSRVEQQLDQAHRYLNEITTSRFMKVNSRLSTESSRLMEFGRQLHRAGLANTGSRKQTLADKGESFRSLAKHILLQGQKDLSYRTQRFSAERILRRVTAEDERLVNKANLVRAQDPDRMLNRGFALLKGGDGKIISTTSDAATLKTAEVHLRDGYLDVSVTDIHPQGDNEK